MNSWAIADRRYPIHDMPRLGLALAAVTGLWLGLLGGGGAIRTAPIFVDVPGHAVKPPLAMSLPVVGDQPRGPGHRSSSGRSS